MRSLSDYKSIYYQIASNLNLTGDSVDLLVNMLANASYIEEVQNINYTRESSLETATQMNSKIVHCINMMYSVFRGTCPRVILKFTPDRVQEFNVFDEIVTSNNFKIYYLGYYDTTENGRVPESIPGTEAVATEEGFVYAPLMISAKDLITADDEKPKSYVIIGLLAESYQDIVTTISTSNAYYSNCPQTGLSNDMYVKIEGEQGFAPVTRHFSDHIEFGKIFDLTLPDFGSRLYIKDIIQPSTTFTTRYFKKTNLSDYNESELRRVQLAGVKMESLNPEWLKSRGYSEETAVGVLFVEGAPKDSVVSTHYNANKERFLNSIFRSNNDMSNLLRESFPEKVKSTYYKYDTDLSQYIIYYIPQENNKLTSEDIKTYVEDKKSYYVTPNIKIQEGTCWEAVFNIRLKLFDISVNVKDEVDDILVNYSKEFNVNLEEHLDLIRSTIGKISNVSEVSGIEVVYLLAGKYMQSGPSSEELKSAYYNISSVLTTSEI